jgi:hypothetical protein
MGSFCNNDDSSPLVAAPIVSLTPATRSVSAVLVPLQSEFDRLQGRHNCPRKGPDYRERAQKYRHALAQAEVLEVPAREAVEPATSSLDCA